MTFALERLIGNVSSGLSSAIFGRFVTFFIFQGVTWSSLNIIRVSYSWAKHVLMIEKSYLNSGKDMTSRFDLSESWVSLNTDGSVRIEDDSGSQKAIEKVMNNKG